MHFALEEKPENLNETKYCKENKETSDGWDFQFSRKTNLLLEVLCTSVKANDIASAEKDRTEMEAKVDEMGILFSVSLSALNIQIYDFFFIVTAELQFS